MSIRILAPHLQRHIAAGEVVERPASALKELVENALDAGAESVRVDVQAGGRRLIQVIDDGAGIVAHEVAVAFERFATSKIANLEDLAAVRSFGFRGEALASIAAVSRVRLVTRERDTLLGTEARLEGGQIRSLQQIGASVGTRVEVWDLFFNRPARQQFLRSLRTEYGHLLDTFTRFALAFPEKRFSLAIDGGERYAFAPSTARERLTAVFGQQVNAHLEEFQATPPWGRLWGIVVPGSTVSQPRVYLFVNRRAVRNATLYRAVREGLPEAGGMVVLFLEIQPFQLDVNIHPTKADVRFREHRQISEWVHHALKRRAPKIPPPMLGVAEAAPPDDEDKGFSLLGQVENTFLLALSAGHLYLIDQHAADERVLYERLSQGKSAQRTLVAPQVVTLSPEERTFVEANREGIQACGFAVEPFGLEALVLRTIPDFLDAREAALVFTRLVARVRSQREELLQALACLGAVKAGEPLNQESQQRLLAAWVETANPHACAHNRPVYYRLALDEVRRKVGRTGLSCEFDQPVP